MRKRIRFAAPRLLLAVAVISGCGQQAPDTAVAEHASPAATAPDRGEAAMSIYAAAVASDARPEADRRRDAGRKPAAVLEFAGIEPGMTVLDMFSGSGWYSEIIARVVGENGHVIAHSNEAYKHFVGDALETRLGGGRLPNTEILMAENNHLALDENSIDAIMIVLSFHDLYHVDMDNDWALMDVPRFLAELKKGLRPGGTVTIVDHTAIAGSPPQTGDSLHRIDPAIVMANMKTAGFAWQASSDILDNPDDDLTQIVFAEGIRGKTDRFVMRFKNPD